MRQGQVVEKFKVKDNNGEKIAVVFRFPSMKDVREAMRLINAIRDESEFLGQRKHETVKSEAKFISDCLKNIKQRRGLFLFVEVDGKLIGSSSICPDRYDAADHVGTFGIALKEEFIGLGIGTKLMKRMLQLAKTKTRFKIIESGFFSKNNRSRKLHEKFGFKQYGLSPNGCMLRKGGYCDHIEVYKQIKKL